MNYTFLHDRFTRGFCAGLAAVLPTLVITFGSYYLWHTLRFLDFASIMIYGSTSVNLINNLFAALAVYVFQGVLGGFFAYLVKWSTSRNLIFKGFLYGGILWFAIYSITLLFKVPQIAHLPFKTALVNFIAAAVWGITMAYSLKWLDRFNVD